MKKHIPVLQYANVPNVITTLGLFSGIAACYFLLQGNLRATIICLMASTLIDFVDGYVALKLDQQTSFGQYLDALVDFFVCCAIPAFMLNTLAANTVLMLVASSFYCACGLWRLAYYISVTAEDKHPYFTGLPVPGAMLLVVAPIWAATYHGLPAWVCFVGFFIAGALMVSSIRLKKYGVCQKLLCVLWLLFLATLIVF
jgi:CDP-diacylglycerol--serine O-phosphatidyltransferase